MITKKFSTQAIVYYNEEEAAEMLEKSVRSVTKMRNSGILKWSFKNGEVHIREDVLLAQLNSEEIVGKKPKKKNSRL